MNTPLLPTPVAQPRKNATPVALPERRQSDASRNRFADSLASARGDRVSDRAAPSGNGCARSGADHTCVDSLDAGREEYDVANARIAAQQRAQVQALVMGGALKFAVTRADVLVASMPAAVVAQPALDDESIITDVALSDCDAHSESAAATPSESVGTLILPVVSWDFPVPAPMTDAQIEPEASAAPNVTATTDESAREAYDTQSRNAAEAAAQIASANAAALQLVATLPIAMVNAAIEPDAPITASDESVAVSRSDSRLLQGAGTASSLPATAESTLVEDHFDAPAAALSGQENAVIATTPAAATVAPADSGSDTSNTRDVRVTAADTAPATAETGGVDRNIVQTDMAKLAPGFRERLERVIDRMRLEYGHTVRVIETVRSQARQDALYAQGRTTPGPVVTWTRNSKHGKGLAADLIVDGAWQNPEGYGHLADIAREEGLRTLGSRDAGHVEMVGGAAVSSETLDALLSDLQSDAGDAARQLSAEVQTETPQQSRTSTMARVANVAQVARVATVASVADVAKVATVARPGESMPQNTPNSSASSPLAVSAVPSVVTSGDTTLGVATPISSVNLADRISHLMDLQATQNAKPLNSVLLRMANVSGIDDQIRVDTRGTSVDARLGLGNAQQAAALTDRIGELRDALERRGLTADGVRVQAASPSRAADGAAATRSIAPTLELAAMRAAADSQAQGNTRDQSAREQAQREAFARDHARHTPRPSSDDARQRSRREQPEDRR